MTAVVVIVVAVAIFVSAVVGSGLVLEVCLQGANRLGAVVEGLRIEHVEHRPQSWLLRLRER